jgi:hypothetical protein
LERKILTIPEILTFVEMLPPQAFIGEPGSGWSPTVLERVASANEGLKNRGPRIFHRIPVPFFRVLFLALCAELFWNF